MASWTHTYREEAIPGPNPSGVITEHKPGQKLAKAVTEIQERAVVDLNLDLEGITDNGSNIENNTLNLRLGTEPPQGTTQTIFAVAGGEWPQLTVQRLTVEDGLIKNVSDGQENYPSGNLYTGNVVTGQSASFNFANRTLRITANVAQVDQGVVVNETGQIVAQTTISPGSATAFSGTVSVVTAIALEDNALVMYRRNHTYSNGILTDVGDEYITSAIQFEPFQCPS